jgi:hypothetical protein
VVPNQTIEYQRVFLYFNFFRKKDVSNSDVFGFGIPIKLEGTKQFSFILCFLEKGSEQ